MPPSPKLFIHGTVVEIGFRTQTGLPFSPAPYIIAILQSILARAQTYYGFTLCHGIMMANHPHLIGVVKDPADVPDFVGYIKRETAHAINSLNDTHGITLWSDGYDSPIILDPQKVIERIVYCYANPEKANLVDTIDKYPNFCTWKAFLNGGAEIRTTRIRRNKIPTLPRATLSLKKQKALAEKLIKGGVGHYTLKIEPNAWMKCFPELGNADPKEINAEIIKRLREREDQYRKERTGNVLGAHALLLESPRMDYVPKKKGKKMICMSSIPFLRVSFIGWYKEHIAQLKDLLLKGRPAGLFSPGGALLANLNPLFVPLAPV